MEQPVLDQYKIRPEGIRQIRNQSLRQSVPLTLLSILIGLSISYYQLGGGQIMLYAVFGVGIMSFGVYRGVKRLEQLYASYILTIDEESIIREQFNTPTVRIPFTDIASISKTALGGFIIKGTSAADTIIIPAQIDEVEKFEQRLNQIIPVTLKTSLGFLDRYRILINCAAMATVFIASNKVAVGIAGVVFLGLTTWSAWTIFRSKNIDYKTRRGMYGIVLALAVVLFIVIYKLFM